MKAHVCKRCAVYKPRKSVTFYGPYRALEHIVLAHQNRLLDAFKRWGPDVNLCDTTVLQWLLRDHNKESK